MDVLPLELAQEFMKDFFCIKHLFEFQWVMANRLTDMDQDVYYGGAWWYAKGSGIRFPEINPHADSITISIDDVGYAIRDIILAEDIREKVAAIYQVALDKSLQPLGTTRRVFYGFCDAPTMQAGSNDIEIRIINHMRYWRRLTPRRVSSPTCQWVFKHGPDKVLGTDSNTYTYIANLESVAHSVNKPTTGASWDLYWELAGSGGATWVEGNWYGPGTCRYVGEATWCDYSWERCLSLFNTINFEGRRWLPSLQDQMIWWGSPNDPKARAYMMKR